MNDKQVRKTTSFLAQLNNQKLAFLAFLAEGKFSSLKLKDEFEHLYQLWKSDFKVYGLVEAQAPQHLVRDSRLVQAGDLFYCEQGQQHSGFDYIDSVLQKGVRWLSCIEAEQKFLWQALGIQVSASEEEKNQVLRHLGLSVLLLPETQFAPAFVAHQCVIDEDQTKAYAFLGEGATTLAYVFYQFFKLKHEVHPQNEQLLPQSFCLWDEMQIEYYQKAEEEKTAKEKTLAWSSPYLKAEQLEALLEDFSKGLYQADCMLLPLKSRLWKKGHASFLNIERLFLKKWTIYQGLSPAEEMMLVWLGVNSQRLWIEGNHPQLNLIRTLRKSLKKSEPILVQPQASPPLAWFFEMHQRHLNMLCAYEEAPVSTEFLPALKVSGKQECLSENPYILIDSAWKVEQVESLLQTLALKLMDYRLFLLMGISAEREDRLAQDLVDFLVNHLRKEDYLWFTVNQSRSESPKAVLERVKTFVNAYADEYTYKEHIFFVEHRKEAIFSVLQMARLEQEKGGKKPLVLLLGRGEEALFVEKQKVEYFTDAELVLDYLKDQA